MSSFSLTIVVGNLGRDPELRPTSSGMAVCNLSVATSTKSKGEEKTEWHRVVVFGEQAENCAKYLKKGRTVCVEGRNQTREWTNKEGQKQRSTEIVANRVTFLGGGDRATTREGIENPDAPRNATLRDMVTAATAQREPGDDDGWT